MEEFDDIRREVARCIGFDLAAVTADDEAAHLDTASLLFSVAGLAIVAFCSGFIEEMAKDLGKKAWAALGAKAASLLKGGPSESLEEQEQVEKEVFLAFRDALAFLQNEKREVELQAGMKEGKKTAARFLSANNLPSNKTEEIVLLIEKQLRYRP
jgi:hypothetical protein